MRREYRKAWVSSLQPRNTEGRAPQPAFNKLEACNAMSHVSRKNDENQKDESFGPVELAAVHGRRFGFVRWRKLAGCGTLRCSGRAEPRLIAGRADHIGRMRGRERARAHFCPGRMYSQRGGPWPGCTASSPASDSRTAVATGPRRRGSARSVAWRTLDARSLGRASDGLRLPAGQSHCWSPPLDVGIGYLEILTELRRNHV